jgi:RNA polymerase sigma-70 factor (ECF subfamily)
MTAAVAQDSKPAAAAPRPEKPAEPTSDLVRNAQPVVVATAPQSGAADVDAATTREIRVTFSKPMQDGNWAFAQTGKETFPQTTGKPHYEPDGRTCVLPVKLEPGKPYVIWLNKPPYDSFSDPAGRKALPYLLVFETKK